MLNTIHECNVHVFIGYANLDKFLVLFKIEPQIKKRSLVWFKLYSKLYDSKIIFISYFLLNTNQIDRMEHEMILTSCDFLFEILRYSNIEIPSDILNAAFTTDFHLRSRWEMKSKEVTNDTILRYKFSCIIAIWR